MYGNLIPSPVRFAASFARRRWPGDRFRWSRACWSLEYSFRKKLQGDVAAESRVFGLVDHAHAAGPEPVQDQVIGVLALPRPTEISWADPRSPSDTPACGSGPVKRDTKRRIVRHAQMTLFDEHPPTAQIYNTVLDHRCPGSPGHDAICGHRRSHYSDKLLETAARSSATDNGRRSPRWFNEGRDSSLCSGRDGARALSTSLQRGSFAIRERAARFSFRRSCR